MKIFHALALSSILGASLVLAQAPAPSKTPAPAPKAVKAAPASAPTAAEIGDAKAKGLVWANLNTKVYHFFHRLNLRHNQEWQIHDGS